MALLLWLLLCRLPDFAAFFARQEVSSTFAAFMPANRQTHMNPMSSGVGEEELCVAMVVEDAAPSLASTI